MSIVEFRSVEKYFGDFKVLEDIDFAMDEGAVVGQPRGRQAWLHALIEEIDCRTRFR